VSHFIFVSIVGIDRIPYPYYKFKVQTEADVRESGVPYSILRATQFHDLLDMVGKMLDRYGPFLFLPTDFQFQPIDAGEVAVRLLNIVEERPSGLLPDMGGPEIRRVRDFVPIWLKKRGIRRIVLPLPLVGKVAYGFRQGLNTCPDHRDGKVTWAQWLD